MHPTRFTALHLEDLANQAERFMLMSYERSSRSLVLHNDSWALALAGHAREIAMRHPAAPPDLPHLARAAALLEAGRHWGAGDEPKSLENTAREFREWTGPDYLQLQLALAAVLPGGSGTGRREVADVLYDAQLAQRILGGTEGAELAWLEDRYRLDPAPERTESLTKYLEELREARFRNGELRRQYQHTHSAVLLDLQQLVDKLGKRKGSGKPAPTTASALVGLEAGPTRQAAQTYFRTVFRNHMQMSTIADQKAAIMISVNALLIGALVTFISYRNWAQTKPEILFPVAVFVVCGLASLIYAVVSARPIIRPDKRDNLAFYGSFSRLTLEDYTEKMEAALLDADSLYGTLIRDLYFLGKTLDRRYELLRLAYSIFLVGIVSSVLLFLGVLFFS